MVMAMLLANFEIATMRTPEGGPKERLALTMSPSGLTMKLARRPASPRREG
jgi:hypothetical protein